MLHENEGKLDLSDAHDNCVGACGNMQHVSDFEEV
jgi:hypothetical protein